MTNSSNLPRPCAGAVVLSLCCFAAFGCGSANHFLREPTAPSAPAALRNVLLVGNSVSGTVSIIDGQTFKNIGSINAIPDLEERLSDINSPLKFWRRLIYSRIKKAQLVKHFEPANGDRFIDDVFLSPDGTKLYVSRSNLGDVAAFDLLGPGSPMIWRTMVRGRKADHAAISPDGMQIVVSASVVRRAQVLETTRGRVVGAFHTGLLPHQNDYSRNGAHIYNGSLGNLDRPFTRNDSKGPRLVTVVDAKTLKVVRIYKFDAGVRPTVITDDESTMYAQLSYLNGLIKFDLLKGQTIATSKQPLSAFAKKNYPTEDDYPHNSAHHGLAVSGDGTLLCDCGTIDNSVSIVSTADLKVEATLEDIGNVPYWATTSADGQSCFVSLSGDAAVVVIDYRTRKEVARIQVDKFPQRSRLGMISEEAIRRMTAVQTRKP